MNDLQTLYEAGICWSNIRWAFRVLDSHLTGGAQASTEEVGRMLQLLKKEVAQLSYSTGKQEKSGKTPPS